MPEVNVAHARMGAQVLQGEMRTALLDGDTTNYDMERGDSYSILIHLDYIFLSITVCPSRFYSTSN